MTLSSQKLYYVGNTFLLILFPSCELPGHTLLHSTWLNSAYQYHGEATISKFTIINKAAWNTEIAHCVCTQKLPICHSCYKPYHVLSSIYYYPFIILNQSCFYCYTAHKNYHAKEYGHYSREFTVEFEAKRAARKTKTKQYDYKAAG